MAKIGKSQVVASNQASASSEDGELHDLNLPSGGMSTDENTGEQVCAAPVDSLVPVAPSCRQLGSSVRRHSTWHLQLYSTVLTAIY